MKKINVEIKAKCEDLERIRKILEKENAKFEGTDRQIDTYFNTLNGRLKLREGNIENCLVSYDRADETKPKLSSVTLYDTSEKSYTLKEILTKHFGIKCVVDKQRDIYHIENIKILLDKVEGLGTFIEIEASSAKRRDEEKLRKQTEEYMKKFGIKKKDLIDISYSDMIQQKDEN